MALMPLEFAVLQAAEYYNEFLALIPKAKKRIVLSAMVVRSGPKTGKILQAMVSAARRNVKVHVLADVFCQHAMVSRPDYLSAEGFRHECAETRELLNEIHALGGTVDWVGRVGLNPYAGRYHAKVSIVDDHVFTFGGVNFCDDAFGNIDYMLYAKQAALADRLERLVADNGKGFPPADLRVQLDAHATLLFDAGRKGESVIYSRATELAAAAKTVTYVSQMCPSGMLGQRIKQTAHTCYFTRPEQTGIRPDTLAQLWDGWRTGIKNQYEGDAYVHAKVILYELKDGTKAVLSGSHNFSYRGVAFGTKEIALESSDPELWRKLHDIVYAVATASGTR
ncbi:MAG TPA: phospholipase D-like domain-containing protein [Candidatus Saccharimonadales bacterium]|nr:phospholipase D-like domain-containing protein [Candidatus Saccharimonadales bacterium]